jgi:tRNA(adenine34) deaminase
MCVGAIIQARVGRLVFGCLDPKAGAVESLYRLCEDRRLNHQPQVSGGILEEECARILKEFFEKLRQEKKCPESR